MTRNAKIEEEIYAYLIENRDYFYKIAYGYTRNREDALDVVQEATYKALLNLDTLKDSSFIKTWYYRILVNSCLDLIRKNKKIVPLLNEDLVEEGGAEGDAFINLEIKDLLESLDEKYKLVVLLRVVEDMRIEDIAEILNLNINTAKTRLYEGFRRLRIEWEEKE